MQTVKVSVIMPAHNRETFIRDSMDSVLAQTFTDFELIVVDDGSTDTTAAIVESYTDRRIRLIRQPNQGVSVARNTGLEAARGEFITFLDSDDLYKTDVSKIRNFIKEKLFGTRILTSDSQIDGLPVHINSVMIAKTLIERYHLRFLPNVRMYEDGNFLFKAFLAAKKICGTYTCLEHYRRHPGSASFMLEGVKEATPIDLRENELEFAEQYGLNREFIRRVKRYEAFKTLKTLWKQKKRNEAAHYVKEHRALLEQFTSTGGTFRDRWICRLLLLAVPKVQS